MISFIDIGDYIRAFDITPDNRKTSIYKLCNAKNELIHLGEIKYNGAWRKYCFYPIDDTVFDNKCLMDIVNFIDQLNYERKHK